MGMSKAFYWCGESMITDSDSVEYGTESSESDDFARKFIETLEKLNNCPIDRVYDRAIAHNGGKGKSAECFGHYLAMQAQGHGVGWGDDHDVTGFIFSLCDAHFYGSSGEIDLRFTRNL